jgi:hypothetical protein
VVGDAVGDALGDALGDAVGEAEGVAVGGADGGVLLVNGIARSTKVVSAPVPSRAGMDRSSNSAERNVESAMPTTTITASTTGDRTAVRG